MAKFTFTKNYDAPLTECGPGGCRGMVAYLADHEYELDEDVAAELEVLGYGYTHGD